MKIVFDDKLEVTNVTTKEGRAAVNMQEVGKQYPRRLFVFLPEGQDPSKVFVKGERVQLVGDGEVVQFKNGGYGFGLTDFVVRRFKVVEQEVVDSPAVSKK